MSLIDRAIKYIGVKRKYFHEGTDYIIAFLIRDEGQKPLSAPWWHGKESSIIGADINGNFFLKHCDGTIRYWHHLSNSETIISSCLKNFLRDLKFDEEGLL